MKMCRARQTPTTLITLGSERVFLSQSMACEVRHALSGLWSVFFVFFVLFVVKTHWQSSRREPTPNRLQLGGIGGFLFWQSLCVAL